MVYSRALIGVTALLVQVEVPLANGLPQFNLDGISRVKPELYLCRYDDADGKIRPRVAGETGFISKAMLLKYIDGDNIRTEEFSGY